MCPELDELARIHASLTSGNPDALRELRPVLHRVVVSASVAGAAKTLAVQALLLLDDPRVEHGGAGGGPLVVKVRKLIESALAAQASGGAVPAMRAGAATLSPDALLSPEIDRALIEEFVTEAREQLAIAEGALLVLDSAPDDVEAVDTMFRALHTIKGTSAFLGVEHATELAHHTESLLARVRNGTATCAGELSNMLFRAIDMLDAIVVSIETAAEGDVAMLPDGFRPLLDVLRKEPHLEAMRDSTPRVSGAVRRVRAIEPTVRVRTSELDRLAELVRELSLTQAMIARDTALRAPSNAEIARKIAHADALVIELEAMAGELRTIPFGNALQKLVRIARDTAHRGGKSVELVTEGEDVLVERGTAEALADPLLHMVRNAIDHGIENAETRARVGKLPAGRLRIAARRSGLDLVIELQDDGRGLDAGRLAETAIARGMLAPGVELAESQAFALILRPGFSTAPIVTDLSGRGVGMDIVRSTVELLGGSIAIDSRIGVGTTFTIRLPFRSHRARNAESWGEAPRTMGLIA
jgi:two-component system, chemotaxis family, sensor kinase CheA